MYAATNFAQVGFAAALDREVRTDGIQARYYDDLLYMLGMLYDSGKFKDWSPAVLHKKN